MVTNSNANISLFSLFFSNRILVLPGDEEPTHPCDGALELLSMRFCPYAQRIHLVLDTKRIPYETVYINLGDKPDWLTKFSPLGKVPALGLLSEANSPYLVESLIVADYLDDKYPGDGGGGDGTGRLHPSDALAKALDRLLVDRFGALFGQTVYRMMTGKGDADTFPALLTGLDHFETELRQRGRPFFGKSTTAPGMLDLMIWPFFERTALLKPLLGDSFAIPFEERYPHLVSH